MLENRLFTLTIDKEPVPGTLEFKGYVGGKVGSSDNCGHKNVANTERKMYMGKIRIAVKPQKGQESFTLTAVSDNCEIAALNCR